MSPLPLIRRFIQDRSGMLPPKTTAMAIVCGFAVLTEHTPAPLGNAAYALRSGVENVFSAVVGPLMQSTGGRSPLRHVN